MSNSVDTTPGTSLLIALAESDLGWKKSLGELIDNAIDHEASEIWITFRKSARGQYVLEFRDNGSGCAELKAFATLGEHKRGKATRLGRFGVGAKDASLWAGGIDSTFEVESAHNGKLRRMSVSWSEMVKKNSWLLVESLPEDAGATVGTTLKVRPLCRNVPGGKHLAQLISELGYLYTPAIEKSGVAIWLKVNGSNTVRLEPYKKPALEPGCIDTTLNIEGNEVRVFAGLVKPGEPNPKPGITYYHGFRVIIPNSGRGCGKYSPARVAGFVELKDGWVLTKNKDNVSRNTEQLFEAVENAIRPILEQSENCTHLLESEALIRSVESKVNAALGSPDTKARRLDGDKRGTKRPTGKGGKHKRAEKEQDGSTFARNRYGRLRIDFQDLGADSHMAVYSAGTVIMNLAHPRVSHLWGSRNDEALSVIAVYEFAHAFAHSSEEEVLGKSFKLAVNGENSNERFHETVGVMLSKGMMLDGAQLGMAAE